MAPKFLMPKARRDVELTVRLGNKVDALGRVLAAVAQQNINVVAYCCYFDRDEGVLLLVTDFPERAKRAIEMAGFDCRANTVVVVGATDQVGGAALLGARLGFAGVEILYSYASSGSNEFHAVFKTTNDERAISVLDSTPAIRAA
jgi:hypothetical protein